MSHDTCQNCEGAGWVLSYSQELALCHIIEQEEADETELQQWQLQSHVNWILAQDYSDSTDSSMIEKCWVSWFLQCHPEYKIQVSHSLTNDWKWSHDIDNLKKWFENHYLRAKHKFVIQDQDTWNFDKTEFRVDVEEKQWVIVIKHANHKLFYEDANDREHLISEEFISDDSHFIQLFVILKR